MLRWPVGENVRAFSRLWQVAIGLGRDELCVDRLFSSAQLWFYQLGSYAILNLLDDPAWLALMFC